MSSSKVNIKPLKRVLVANRGEIAVRIIRALRELSIESVALYSDADRESLHVHLADYAIRITGDTSLEQTYLDHNKVIQAALMSNCDGLHPGYGFLSENEAFVSSLEQQTTIRFIGPSAHATRELGDKVRAKELAKKVGIPVLGGSSQALSSLSELKEISTRIGLPIVLKASAGGGGRGMRVVTKLEDLSRCYTEAKREALSCFGEDGVFCEKYLLKPRHIEFQTLFDDYGGAIHLYERDCSVQRRYQKIIEEAPSPVLNHRLRTEMGVMAINLGLSAGYSGVATVEFICDGHDYYFMEMNTRIQVEHPVTEMITGIDLVKESVRVAEGRPLSLKQEDIVIRGHAIELRVNAEDPCSDFAPSFGRIDRVQWPSGPFTRVDSHIFSGYQVPDIYDSLLGKIIVWGHDRKEAILRARRALKETEISPLETTISFHETLLAHQDFVENRISTTYLGDHKDELLKLLDHDVSQLDQEEVRMMCAVLVEHEWQKKSVLPPQKKADAPDTENSNDFLWQSSEEDW
ncbi:MAG: ATP-grasp domain-containing protein [Proteobacteria bacterium]|nr:ATP-grasp domain-containing protein [Pseudomonadota bacterium]